MHGYVYLCVCVCACAYTKESTPKHTVRLLCGQLKVTEISLVTLFYQLSKQWACIIFIINFFDVKEKKLILGKQKKS